MESPEERIPEISVILHTANHVGSLYTTLICLSNQENAENLPFEIIVIDSGTDDLDSILALFGGSDESFIQYERVSGLCNRAANFNRGAAIARGQILVFIEDDFLVSPEYLVAHFRAHAAKRNVVVLDSCRMLGDFRPEKIGYDLLVRKFSLLESMPSCPSEGSPRAFPVESCAWRQLDSSGFSVRRESFAAANSFCEEYAAGSAYCFADLGMRLCKIGASFETGLVPTTFRHSRQYGGGSNDTERDIFLRRNPCFESELYAGFQESFDRYYPGLMSLSNEVYPRLLAECPPGYDLVLGCICDATTARESEVDPRLLLGALIPSCGNASVNRALILSTFYFLSYRMQLSILSEALRVAKEVDVQRRTGVNGDFVEGLCRVVGYIVSVAADPDVFRIAVRQRCPSRLFSLSIPDVFSPRSRFFYLHLARELQQSGAFVICNDIRGADNFYGEDFSLPRDVASSMSGTVSGDHGCYDVRAIASGSLMHLGFPLAANRKDDIVVNDQEYASLSGLLPYQKYERCRHLDKEFIERHCVRYFAEFLRRNPPSRLTRDPGVSAFGCFMESGFLEDGVDLVLEGFSAALAAGLRGSLVLKLPDYDMLAGKNFPQHNSASRYGKNYGTMYKAEHDSFLLEKKVRDLDLESHVTIARQNMDIFGIVRLIDSLDTLICATRGAAVPAEVYAAILLGKRVLLPVQCCIDSRFSPAVVRVSSELFPFAASFGVPVYSTNVGFLAYEINVGDLATKIPLKEDYEPIDASCCKFVDEMIDDCKRDLAEL